ncbi:Uncharacterized protein dnm_092590 [Desulfonema magnum]|uniref:Uncharacterized protein n=1 Tax=Desulfonema magnum TaxID=45655 RepID=A0A975GTN3_9BACT|nr:Uncharacterized protein dnm_092590 [Desulfonema magnum]
MCLWENREVPQGTRGFSRKPGFPFYPKKPDFFGKSNFQEVTKWIR